MLSGRLDFWCSKGKKWNPLLTPKLKVSEVSQRGFWNISSHPTSVLHFSQIGWPQLLAPGTLFQTTTLKRKPSDTDVKNEESRKKLPRRSIDTTTTSPCCFFCQESSGELHRTSTFNLDRKVRESVSILNDTSLLGKLSAGDIYIILSVYHNSTREQQESKIKLSHKMTRTLYTNVLRWQNWFQSLKNAEVIQMKIKWSSCLHFEDSSTWGLTFHNKFTALVLGSD